MEWNGTWERMLLCFWYDNLLYVFFIYRYCFFKHHWLDGIRVTHLTALFTSQRTMQTIRECMQVEFNVQHELDTQLYTRTHTLGCWWVSTLWSGILREYCAFNRFISFRFLVKPSQLRLETTEAPFQHPGVNVCNFNSYLQSLPYHPFLFPHLKLISLFHTLRFWSYWLGKDEVGRLTMLDSWTELREFNYIST